MGERKVFSREDMKKLPRIAHFDMLRGSFHELFINREWIHSNAAREFTSADHRDPVGKHIAVSCRCRRRKLLRIFYCHVRLSVQQSRLIAVVILEGVVNRIDRVRFQYKDVCCTLGSRVCSMCDTFDAAFGNFTSCAVDVSTSGNQTGRFVLLGFSNVDSVRDAGGLVIRVKRGNDISDFHASGSIAFYRSFQR